MSMMGKKGFDNVKLDVISWWVGRVLSYHCEGLLLTGIPAWFIYLLELCPFG